MYFRIQWQWGCFGANSTRLVSPSVGVISGWIKRYKVIIIIVSHVILSLFLMFHGPVTIIEQNFGDHKHDSQIYLWLNQSQYDSLQIISLNQLIFVTLRLKVRLVQFKQIQNDLLVIYLDSKIDDRQMKIFSDFGTYLFSGSHHILQSHFT